MLGDTNNKNNTSIKLEDIEVVPASLSSSSSSEPPPEKEDKTSKNDGTLSKSVVENFRKQQMQVALVTFAVLTAAASYVMMLFIAMPISIHLIINTQRMDCDPEVSADCFAATDESQRVLTITLSLLRMMTFLMGSTVGVLSDRWGRRPLLLAALSGYAITGGLFLIGWKVQTIGLFIFGGMILGASSPVTPHGYAYISDISRPDRLATNMGILQGGGYFIGLLSGALVSLAISEATRGKGAEEGESALEPYNKLFYASYATGMGFSMLVAILMLFFLPESLHKDLRKTTMNWKKANPFGFLTLITRSAYLFCLWMSAAFGWMAVGAGESVTGGWWLRRFTQSDVNMFIMFTVMIWLGGAFGAAIMTPIFVRLFGLKGTIHFSMVATILVGVGFACSPTVNISYNAVGLSFLAAPVVPAKLTLIMGQVPATEKGALAGAVRSSEAFAKLCGILILGNTFANYIEAYKPDVSCVPLDYSSSNPINSCDCGVNTCPTYDPTNSSGRVMNAASPFYYEAATCTLGNLSPMFAGKVSAHVPFNSPEPRPIVPQLFVDEGLVSRDGSCVGGGGRGDYDERQLDRQWCVSVSAMTTRYGEEAAQLWNQEYGCPGFDFGLYSRDIPKYENLQICEEDISSPDCDLVLYNETISNPESLNYDASEFNRFAGVYKNITEGVSATCESFGTADMNMCWDGVIAGFPGLFPFIYFSMLGVLAYVFFIIAEVFFRHQDREFWLMKKPAAKSDPESATAPEATVRPTA
mmetsp:Transcript_13687/g.26481  ORF Transcript_13687/g.26481 Transcript_13687/m.26481 type:complete len:755 (-) Transcript_13687:239-2503(-)|eukprot:CAMPEP_0171578514 /NCGR_PEP_ID=MMETSP0961-20121227/7903_1 /TAXON_ID=87120 /ORGANISM="Aurantiochytrium limacinum, Strain ATCCMYA-1381" /LENGTH=754 /DNA_ID=CAMNT_0012134845 /DNA_START=458 /DNA_END=2722 /DNA_ORIENTATION=+